MLLCYQEISHLFSPLVSVTSSMKVVFSHNYRLLSLSHSVKAITKRAHELKLLLDAAGMMMMEPLRGTIEFSKRMTCAKIRQQDPSKNERSIKNTDQAFKVFKVLNSRMQILLFASLLLLQINFGLVLEMSSGETCFVLTLKVSAGGV